MSEATAIPRYAKAETIRAARIAITHPAADIDNRAHPDSAAFRAYVARIDAIEEALKMAVAEEAQP